MKNEAEGQKEENQKQEKKKEASMKEGEQKLHVKEISIEALVIPIHHPRKHPSDIKNLESSIRRDGLQEPLLVYAGEEGKFLVIDGARRLTVVAGFGWKTVPCIIKKGLTDRDAVHLSYVKNMERNGLDPIDIALHLKTMRDTFGYTLDELELKGYGSKASISNKLKLLGLPEVVQKNIQEQELSEAHGLQLIKLPTSGEQERMAKQIIQNDISAERAKNRIKRYLEKGNKKPAEPKNPLPVQDIPGVYIKDSRDMSELLDKTVHLIVTSPPYNVGMEFEKGVTHNEHLEMVKGVLNECARVLVLGGVMAVNVGDMLAFKEEEKKDAETEIKLMGTFYQSCLKPHGIYLKDIIIWKKAYAWSKPHFPAYTEHLHHTSYRIINNFEPVYIFRKKGERVLPSEEIILKSKLTKEEYVAWTPGVWDIQTPTAIDGHPCIFPDELPRRLIKMFSYEGDMVLDPWLGSGTTVKVAKELKREAVGYEKEPQYKAVIMKRLGIETIVDFVNKTLEGPAEDKESKSPKPFVFGTMNHEFLAKTGEIVKDEPVEKAAA